MQASKSYMALKVFHEMRSQKCKPNICTFTALVNAFAREGLCEKAEEIFEQLQDAGHEPDVYAYNALMEAYRSIFSKSSSLNVSSVVEYAIVLLQYTESDFLKIVFLLKKEKT